MNELFVHVDRIAILVEKFLAEKRKLSVVAFVLLLGGGNCGCALFRLRSAGLSVQRVLVLRILVLALPDQHVFGFSLQISSSQFVSNWIDRYLADMAKTLAS